MSSLSSSRSSSTSSTSSNPASFDPKEAAEAHIRLLEAQLEQMELIFKGAEDDLTDYPGDEDYTDILERARALRDRIKTQLDREREALNPPAAAAAAAEGGRRRKTRRGSKRSRTTRRGSKQSRTTRRRS